MFDSTEIPTRHVTKDEALAVIIAWTTPAEFDPTVDTSQFSFETTAREWINTFEAMSVRGLGRALNLLFGVRLGDDVWKRILEPVKERTLGDVCDLLARHATVTCVVPVTVMGDTSLAAGAFLAVRQILAKAGVDVSNLRPSSEIAPVLRSMPTHAWGELMRIAPGRLPTVQVDAPFHSVCLGVCVGSLQMQWILGRFPAAGNERIACCLLAAFSFLLALAAGRFLKPRRVQFAWTHTFKDLSLVIVGQRCPTGQGFALD
jgi:hypothetical protein